MKTAPSQAQLLHVVMLPYPVQGHINPMMQLAKVLIAKHSIMVTFINSKLNHDRIQRERNSTSSTPVIAPSSNSNIIKAHPDLHQLQDSQLQFLWVDNGLSPDFDYTTITTKSSANDFHFATYNMKEPLKQLLQGLNQKSPPVSCVIFGSFCPWAHNVAEECGIPSILFWTQSTSVCSMYHHAPLLAANGLILPHYNKVEALPGQGNQMLLLAECDEQYSPQRAFDKVSCIPGVPPLHPQSFPTLLFDSSSSPFTASLKEQFGIVRNCAGVIVNSFEELEKDAYQALQAELRVPVWLVGPLLPAAFLEGGEHMSDTSIGASLLQENNECIQWLDSQRNQSVLYISFGSLFNPSADDVEGIAHGIRASKQPFLWVIKPGSSVHNVADILPERFMEDTKEYGLIVPWSPQVQVLSHPSVGAFLTHCGWNSTLESVSMGIPMIPFPFSSDQPTNCAYVCEVWKIGMALIKRQDDGKVKSTDVEAVVRTVLQEEEGKEMRKRASELREAARRAMLPQGSSNIHMANLIEAMRNQSVKIDRI